MKITYREINNGKYTIRGLLTTPDEPFKQIAVLLHGYTGHKNENGMLFKQIAKTLSDQGVATLRYDYMGSGDSDGDFCMQTFDTVVADALNVLKEAYALNGNKKVFLLGFSMGGTAAGVLSSIAPELIEKLLLLSPAGNMEKLLENTFKDNPVIDDNYVDLGGYCVSRAFHESLKGRNVYKDIEKFTQPVLVIQGSNDKAVSPHFSNIYAVTYPHAEYILLENGTHCYTNIEHRKFVNKKICEFFKA